MKAILHDNQPVSSQIAKVMGDKGLRNFQIKGGEGDRTAKRTEEGYLAGLVRPE